MAISGVRGGTVVAAWLKSGIAQGQGPCWM
jgi:hypothetical protein